MSEIKLKPCPFCGNGKIEILSEPEELDDINYSQFVACCSVLANGCGATGGFAGTEQEAADKWNRRADTNDP